MKELHPQSPEERRKRLARLRARFGKKAIERAKREIKPLIVAKRVGIGLYDDGFIHAGNLAYLSLLAMFPFFILAAAVARLFGHPERGRLLLNLGGIANVTWVPLRGMTADALAFDTGPGVGVIDSVVRRFTPDMPFDRDGERARQGQAVASVLERLLADAYFAQSPPKSTGRERFGPAFADRLIQLVRQAGGSENDAIATATALTAETVARAIARWTPPAGEGEELVISGGGARNPALVEQLAARVHPRPIESFDTLFFDGDAKEAVVFAFLGHLTLSGRPGNLPAATGARGSRVLGHVTPV
jgi:anhydro-N-acetylmuramic acid kinase